MKRIEMVDAAARMFLFLLLAVILTGCGGGAADRPETVPVSGAVAYQGKAGEGARGTFLAEGAPRAATAVTDKEGKFQLSTFTLNDGAVVGTHIITVTKQDPAAAADAGNNQPPDPEEMAKMMQESMEESGYSGLLPEKYSSAKSTPLSETVSEAGPNEFVLQLTD